MNQLSPGHGVALSSALIACTTFLSQPAGAQTSIQTAPPADSSRVTVAAGQVARATADSLVRRALQANRELSSARLDLERGRARLRQAGLRPNPTVDIEQSTGRLTGSPDERDLSLGFALPIELGARRQRRMDVAEAELAVIEAEVADRERQLTREVLSAYAGALAALRELQITSNVQGLDEQTLRVVRIRVDARDAPALELNLLLTEADRLRSRRALIEGRLEAALITLKHLIGTAASEPLPLDEPLPALAAHFGSVPVSVEAAIAIALQQRPDLRLARLSEAAAQAGLRLARAEAYPDMTVSGKFTASRTANDLPVPLAPVVQDDRALAFGVSIALPFLNANQGARAEAAIAIRQAQMRREFVELAVRAEVTRAFRRSEATRAALAIFERGVIDRSTDNIRVIRASYELGEFRITDLINEQRRLLDSQREYAEVLVERYQTLADLQAAIGTTIGAQP